MPGTSSYCRGEFNSPRHGFTLEGTSPFIIGVAGGTASGKSSVCQKILDKISGEVSPASHHKKVICLSLDQFYLDLSGTDAEKARRGQFNFDHPDAFDFDLILSTMKKIKEGKSNVVVQCYDYINNQRQAGSGKEVEPAHVVFLEGILAFYWPELREMYDMKLFVDTDADTRLSRRVSRDVSERGRNLDQILNQYVNSVKPAFEDFCLPTKKFADIIIPRGAENSVAIDLIAQSIRDLLASRRIGSGAEENAASSTSGLTKRNSSARLH